MVGLITLVLPGVGTPRLGHPCPPCHRQLWHSLPWGHRVGI